MSDRNDQTTNENFRLPFTLRNVFLVFLPYAAILLSLQVASGVHLEGIGDSEENLRNFALIPVGAASVYLVIVGLITGWIRTVWRDVYQIKGHDWLHVFAILFIISIMISFASGNILSQPGGYLLTALAAIVLVGFSEELMFRGYAVQGARRSGYSEMTVLLLTSIFFGLFHGINIISGAAIPVVSGQMINATILGAAFYIVFRKTGFIAMPMVLHFFLDFSILTKGSDLSDHQMVLSAAVLLVPVLFAILLVMARKHIRVSG